MVDGAALVSILFIFCAYLKLILWQIQLILRRTIARGWKLRC